MGLLTADDMLTAVSPCQQRVRAGRHDLILEKWNACIHVDAAISSTGLREANVQVHMTA